MERYFNTLDIQDRLDPRDSFFWGRTTAVKLYNKVQGEEKINYIDFTSLYSTKFCFSTHCGDAFWNSLYNNGRFYVHVAHF